MFSMRSIGLLGLCLLCTINVFGQYNMINSKSRKIKFKLVNNIVIIPVELNGVALSFVLDTGVTKAILFDIESADSTKLKTTQMRYIKGLGGGSSIKAKLSKGNILKLGDVTKVNQDLYQVYDTFLNFTPRLGIPVHGIIGYDLFKEFIVELNYGSKYLRLHKHKNFKYSKVKHWTPLPISIHKKKPFIDVAVQIDNSNSDLKLLMDTGGSDALWLFKSNNRTIKPKDSLFFRDFLGYGLSGSVYGKRSKVNKVGIGEYEQFKVNVAFPDSLDLSQSNMYEKRDGSISGNLLKRFNYFFDYQGEIIYIKSNKLFNEPYHYNNSGLVVEQRGTRLVREIEKLASGDLYNRQNTDGQQQISNRTTYRYSVKPAFQIVEIRKNSNAYLAGLRLGDIITSINNEPAHTITLQELNKFFYDVPGRVMRLKIDRDNKILSFRFELDDVFKKKDLQLPEGL